MVYTTNNRLQQILATRKGASVSIAGATFFMVVLMLILAILPAYRSITDQLKNNEAKLVYLNELKTKRQNMDTLNEEYTLNQKMIELYETYNSEASNSEVMLANLAQIAKAHNCIMSNVTFADPKTTTNVLLTEFSGMLEVKLAIVLTGSISDLSLLLKDLECFPVPINFENVNYVHHKDTADNSQILEDVLISSDPRFDLNIDANYYIWTKTQ